jgi:hypothetical protein
MNLVQKLPMGLSLAVYSDDEQLLERKCSNS